MELERLQFAWSRNWDIERISEGDTYPRPRYNVPSRPLELFDLAMLADGTAHGMLQYLFDYNHSLSYETGYARRLLRNRSLRRQVAELFAGKRGVGVRVFDVMHKLRAWPLPEALNAAEVSWLQAKPSKGLASQILSRNSIPTAYGEGDYPVLLLGENARYIPLEDLAHGAILDGDAAAILQALSIVGVGMLGIFVVTLVIIGVVTLLNKLS